METKRTRKSAATGSSSSSSLAKKTPLATTSPQCNKCAPNSSKFQRILSNLERSIMNQFNVGSSGGDDNRDAATSKLKQTANRTKPSPLATKNCSAVAQAAAAVVKQQQKIKARDEQQVRKDLIANQSLVKSKVSPLASSPSVPTPSTPGQLKADAPVAHLNHDNGGKTTLNKFQQQIVSTLRPSQLFINNKLSIPPPHANDEARNQNHRILFGDSVAQPAAEKSFDSCHFKPAISSNNQHSGAISEKVSANKFLDCHNRLNSSPATSAKSLPPFTNPPGSLSKVATTNSIEDEESGFSTYQSRRSIIGTRNPNTKATGNTKEAEEMIIISTNTHPSSGYMNHQNLSTQHINDHSHPHLNRQMNTQQQKQLISPSNQVPIVTVESGLNYLNNNQLNTNLIAVSAPTSQRIHQSQFNDEQHNLGFGAYLQSRPMLSGLANIDSGQQIYANAPPKPRRYQYYDSSQKVFPQIISPLTTPASMAATTILSNSHSGRMHPHYHQQINLQALSQQQQQAKQRLSNQTSNQISHLTPMYQHATPFQMNSGSSQQNGSYLQQRPSYPPPQLTKSKSSLDAHDLMRFKLERQQSQGFELSQPNILRTQPQFYRQQNLYDARNDFLDTQIGLLQCQPSSQVAQSNLHRSKSVTHLLQFEQERLRVSQQANGGQPAMDSKLLTVSSASTNNLNYVGLAGGRQQAAINHFSKNPSQLDVSHQQQYHDSIQHQANQLFSLAALRQQQQQRINNWSSHHQAANINTAAHNNSHQSQHITNNYKTNPSFSNNGKVVRQSQSEKFAHDDAFAKPSLDEKIRHLMIGKDCETVRLETSGPGHRNDSFYEQSCNNANGNNMTQAAWATNQLSTNCSSTSLLVGGNPATRPETCMQQSASVSLANSSASGKPITGQAHQSESARTNQVFIDESRLKMGNYQQRQYFVTDGGKQAPKDAQTAQFYHQQQIEGTQRKSEANSHLIVDLTTPRVLAKTQTTLVSSGTNQPDKSDSWSINQVGLPQNSPLVAQGNQQRSPLSSKETKQPSGNCQETSYRQNILSSMTNHTMTDVDTSNCCERTAPYYYSDLKSEEQQKALLSIVQQKSLSPPPQLLSRSTDHNSTRLALKSATLHPNQARMLSESLAQRHNRLARSESQKFSPQNEFSSTSNISRNIDKLFNSPAPSMKERAKTFQSMLALSDSRDTTDASHLSSLQGAKSGSMSSDYFSGDMKSKNFSKSKSLENIDKPNGDTTEITVNKFGIPVYENIRRSDKLLHAINNSSICLSSTKNCLPVERKSNFPSDESMDSILGSSLEVSDSSLDIIDEVKISPTDNHLSDISQLIEQLKNNHSKLTEKHKATLVKISKTVNSKNRQTISNNKSEELARRLHLLELKSKKCESRSKNQLALIQMIEKVLKQSRSRASGSQQHKNSEPNNDSRALQDQLRSSPCLSSGDYRKGGSKHSSTSVGSSSQEISPNSSTFSSACDTGPSHNIFKAVVKEGKSAEKFEVRKRSDTDEEQVSLSTMHQRSLKSSNNSRRFSPDSAVGKRILNIEAKNEQKQSRNPFEDNVSSSGSSDADTYDESDFVKHHIRSQSEDQSNDNDLSNLMKDDEDFIEFLSTDGSISHRSQFEASQFSASDFNTSSSTSESSASGKTKDSLNSATSSAMQLSNKGTANTGILKGAKSVSNHDYSGAPESSIMRELLKRGDGGRENETPGESKFKNVLGNVIDVDVCSVKNLSHC